MIAYVFQITTAWSEETGCHSAYNGTIDGKYFYFTQHYTGDIIINDGDIDDDIAKAIIATLDKNRLSPKKSIRHALYLQGSCSSYGVVIDVIRDNVDFSKHVKQVQKMQFLSQSCEANGVEAYMRACPGSVLIIDYAGSRFAITYSGDDNKFVAWSEKALINSDPTKHKCATLMEAIGNPVP